MLAAAAGEGDRGRGRAVQGGPGPDPGQCGFTSWALLPRGRQHITVPQIQVQANVDTS